jgi:hypothetical protein
VALALAWVFDLTPKGIKRTDGVSPNEYTLRWSARKLVAVIVIVAMLAAGLLAFQLVRNRSTSPLQVTAASALAEKSIAVLPLLNENGNPSDEYFSDGEQRNALSPTLFFLILPCRKRMAARSPRGLNPIQHCTEYRLSFLLRW